MESYLNITQPVEARSVEFAGTETEIVLVVGMHRSGTSAVTRGLQTMNVALGDRLWPPNEKVNAKGFWEDMDINALNVEMMKALDTDWHYLAPIDSRQIETLHTLGFLPRAMELLRAKVGDSPRFGFKDPRVAKLLPFWKEVVARCQYQAKYLLTTRHPSSVVQSIQNRDGFDAEKNYLLWLVHMLEMLNATAGCTRVLVDYDRLMEAPERELRRTGIKFGYDIDADSLKEYHSDFLDEELRHTTFLDTDLSANIACAPLVREVYLALLDVATDKLSMDSAHFQSRLDQWQCEFSRLTPALRLVDKLWARGDVVASNIVARDQHLSDFDAKITALRAELVAQSDRGEMLNAIVAQRKVEIAELCHALDERAAQIVTLNHLAVESEARATEERRALREIIDSEHQKNAQLRRELVEIREEIAEVYRSRSWRLSLPLRRIESWAVSFGGTSAINDANTSNEPVAAAASYEELMRYRGKPFIEAAYITLLKREPDMDGLNYYFDRLNRGASQLQILAEIFFSQECRAIGADLLGLGEAMSRAAKLARWR